MLVSIAMTTFNGEKHLQEQLDSFLVQSRLPDELVVCDDGSTDDTLDILYRFKGEAPFDVHIHRNATNLGFTQNFSQAMKKSTGDVIFLSDQDDVWDSRKLEVVLGFFRENPDVWLVVHDGKLVSKELDWHGATKLSQLLAGFDGPDSLVMGSLTAYRRELGRLVLPVPQSVLGHDKWLHLLAGLMGRRLVVDNVLQLIRRHGSNTSGWIASSVDKITWWDVFEDQWRTSIANDYSDRMAMNGMARQVLHAALKENDSDGHAERIRASLDFLSDEMNALLARQNIVRRTWMGRKLSSIRLLLSGGYNHFNGVKSFLRDIAR